MTFSLIRLEKLCRPDGGKVRLRLEDSVASFQLNSSLIPGNIFNCHLELVLETSDSGEYIFLLYVYTIFHNIRVLIKYDINSEVSSHPAT